MTNVRIFGKYLSCLVRKYRMILQYTSNTSESDPSLKYFCRNSWSGPHDRRASEVDERKKLSFIETLDQYFVGNNVPNSQKVSLPLTSISSSVYEVNRELTHPSFQKARPIRAHYFAQDPFCPRISRCGRERSSS